MNSIKIGICQLAVGPNKENNIKNAELMIKQAVNSNCQMVVLPEMFICPCHANFFSQYAEEIPGGETYSKLKDMSNKGNIYIVGGSIPEKDKQGHIFNTSLVFDPKGQLIAKHRKIHLFDVNVEGGIAFCESDTISAGNNITTFDTIYGKMGLAICYDLRFPELSRLMTLDGARILIYPAAFNTTTGPIHWELLLRSRAVDNQVFMIGVGPAPCPESPYPAYGHSMVVDPWGEILIDVQTNEELAILEVDLEKVDKVRRELPLILHRREDVYNISTAKTV